jgi:dihydrofolate reductase
MPQLSLIAALSTTTRAIGKDNKLLWTIPEDLKRFKALTMGHPIVMGSTTFASIGRPLPGRPNIVITKDTSWEHEGVIVSHSIDDAIAIARSLDHDEVFVIGGGQVYKQTIALADRLYLTLIDDDAPGDVVFPEYTTLPFVETEREEHEHNGLHYAWVTLDRTV